MTSYPPPNSNYSLYNSANFTYATDSITLETADSRYLKLTGSIAPGLQTLNGGVSVANIYNSGNTFTVPSSSGQLALTSQIPSLSNYATLDTTQTVRNKTFQASSNSGIASFTATTITTSFPHNLVVGDIISFPYIGSMSGIVISTNYTIATTPSTTQFTMSGITSMGGTVNNAYYVLITRATANESIAGGIFRIVDSTVSSNGLYFDVSGSTIPNVVKFQAATSALPITFPTFGGFVAVLNNTQTFTGNKTFSGQLISTRAGQTTAASAAIYGNPGSTAMTGANNYYFTHFILPPSTGSTTGFAATVNIAGQPANSNATTSAALRIETGNFQMLGTGLAQVPNLKVSAAGSSIGGIVRGSTAISPPGANGPAITITHNLGITPIYLNAIVNKNGQPIVADNFTVSIQSFTTTQAVFEIWRVDTNSSWTGTYQLVWIVMG